MLISQFFMTQTLNYTNFKTLTNKYFQTVFLKVIDFTLNKLFLFKILILFLSITLKTENKSRRKCHASCAYSFMLNIKSFRLKKSSRNCICFRTICAHRSYATISNNKSREEEVPQVAQNFRRGLYKSTTISSRNIFCVSCIQVILLQPQNDISSEHLFFQKQPPRGVLLNKCGKNLRKMLESHW